MDDRQRKIAKILRKTYRCSRKIAKEIAATNTVKLKLHRVFFTEVKRNLRPLVTYLEVNSYMPKWECLLFVRDEIDAIERMSNSEDLDTDFYRLLLDWEAKSFERDKNGGLNRNEKRDNRRKLL